MNWLALIRKFPKFALVVGVVVGSTALFAFWWVRHSAKKAIADRPPPVAEDITPKLKLIESRWDHIILVDNDLYDVDDGQLLFKNWLKEGVPLRLYFDESSKTLIARYARGFVRYKLDGTEQAVLAPKSDAAFSDDLKSVVFVKDKDIWQATVNWPEMKFEDDKKITSIEQFYEQGFAGNVILRTERTLVVRNLNQILRVNLESGEVHPMKVRLDDFAKRRSPNSRWLVGINQGQFFCYDVDADTLKSLPVGRATFTDCQWLDNDRCAILLGSKSVLQYDRLKNELNKITELTAPCLKIGDLSPSGRFVFCIGNRSGVLVDLEEKREIPVTGGAGIAWVSDDTFAFSREVADSGLRGTWIQTAGQTEQRASPEPYLVRNSLGSMLSLPSADIIAFATTHGLCKMKANGTEVRTLLNLSWNTGPMVRIQEWDAKQQYKRHTQD